MKKLIERALFAVLVVVVLAASGIRLGMTYEPAEAYELYSSTTNGKVLTTQTSAIVDHYGIENYLAPNGEVTALPLYKLVGDSFATPSLDTNFWTASVGSSGVVSTANAQLTLSTGTVANNAVYVDSVNTARFSGLAPNKLRIVVQIPAPVSVHNNSRHWGIRTQNTANGAEFDLTDGVLCAVLWKTGVATKICSGSFNGQYGTDYVVDTRSHFYEIIYQPRQVVFLADNKVIHTHNAAPATWSDTLQLPIHVENFNTNGSTTNVSMFVRLGTIARFGIPQTQPVSHFIRGLSADTLLKNSPGNLHGVVISSVTNNANVTCYDAVAASGVVIWSSGAMPSNAVPFSVDMHGIQFSNGLDCSVTGASADALIIYE